MRARRVWVGLAGLLMVLRVSASEAAPEVMIWHVDGDAREAIVYAPESPRRGDLIPVVLSFHGYGDNMENFQRTSVHLAWPEALVVYFQGLPTGRGLRGWQVEPRDANRDLKLVDTALASLHETYPIDDDRIYATGFSNGGMFTYLLWSERPDVFAAYAPVAARLRSTVHPDTPRPIFHVAGVRDRVVSFSDQEAAIDVALQVNGVGDRTTACGDGCTLHGIDTPAPVMTWIHAGAHVYPQGTTERIVAFFRDHMRQR